MNIKENIPLIVGIALPVVLIIAVAAAIYLPGVFAKPSVNFVYALGNYPRYCEEQEGDRYIQHTYAIQSGKIIETTQNIEGTCFPGESMPPQFMAYDVSTEKTEPVTIDELKKVTLSPAGRSSDGFTISHGREGGAIFPFVFFTETDYSSVYITGQNMSQRLNIDTANTSSPYGGYQGFSFVGWLEG